MVQPTLHKTCSSAVCIYVKNREFNRLNTLLWFKKDAERLINLDEECLFTTWMDSSDHHLPQLLGSLQSVAGKAAPGTASHLL